MEKGGRVCKGAPTGVGGLAHGWDTPGTSSSSEWQRGAEDNLYLVPSVQKQKQGFSSPVSKMPQPAVLHRHSYQKVSLGQTAQDQLCHVIKTCCTDLILCYTLASVTIFDISWDMLLSGEGESGPALMHIFPQAGRAAQFV